MAVKPAAEAAIDKIGSVTHDAVSTVVSTVGPALDDARDRLAPVVDDARDRLAPMVDDARERLAPMVEDARDKITPAAATAVAATKDRGQKAAVRLGLVEEPKKETHRLRNLLIVLGLSGVAAFVYARLTGRDADPAWTASRDTAAASTSSYEGATSVDPTAADDAAVVMDADDAASSGASTDESDTAPTAPLASQESVGSHQPTTPDEPLERREI
ncbi:MAG: hypothetical protein ACR2LE_05700 [Nocardioidaceae bacterium]